MKSELTPQLTDFDLRALEQIYERMLCRNVALLQDFISQKKPISLPLLREITNHRKALGAVRKILYPEDDILRV